MGTVSYGADDDPKLNEDWFVCGLRRLWFHDTCAQSHGIFDDIDDDDFTCDDCI